MTNKILKDATLLNHKVLKNSYYGNPRYQVTWSDGTTTLTGNTAANAQCGYTVTNFSGNAKHANVEYHETAAGNIIFTDFKEV